MRIACKLLCPTQQLPLDIRRTCLHVIKQALAEYDQQLFSQLYEQGHNRKGFTFSTGLGKGVQFNQEYIQLQRDFFELTISSGNLELMIHLINALQNQFGKTFPANTGELEVGKVRVLVENQPQNQRTKYQILSPILVREHQGETKKDFYFSTKHQRWQEQLYVNLATTLQIDQALLQQLIRFEVGETRRTVVKFYQQHFEATIGKITIEAPSEFQKFFYEYGLGSKTSSGFGMLKVDESGRLHE